MISSSILWILLAVVVVGAILYFARLKARPIQPNLTMAEAWSRFVNDLENDDSADLKTWKEIYQLLPPEQRQLAKDNLLEIEGVAVASQKPMLAIRAAAMKALDTEVIAEEILALDAVKQSALEAQFGKEYSKPIVCGALFHSGLTTTVLRHYYTKVKYDDAIRSDWFDYYRAASKKLAAGKIQCMVTVANDPTDTISSLLADQYVNLFEQLKHKVLDSPRKTPLDFSKLDKPIALPEPPSRTRIRKAALNTDQIAALSALMDQRLTGILSGDLYVAEGVRAPNAAEYFRMDSGILLSLLTVNLEQEVDSVEYLRQIISPVLTKAIPNAPPQGVDNLLSASRSYRDTWLKHEPDDAPLAAILPFGVAAAYDLLDELNSETFNGILKCVSTTVVTGASKLVQGFYKILDAPNES